MLDLQPLGLDALRPPSSTSAAEVSQSSHPSHRKQLGAEGLISDRLRPQLVPPGGIVFL